MADLESSDEFRTENMRRSILSATDSYLTMSNSWQPYEEKEEIKKLSDLARFKLEIRGDYFIRQVIKKSESDQKIKALLADMADELTSKLLETLSLAKSAELNIETTESAWSLTSISPDKRNKYADEWTQLVELCRVSFGAVAVKSSSQARALLSRWVALWHQTNFSLFRRLALNLANEFPKIGKTIGAKLILESGASNLWDRDCRAEVLQFLRGTGLELFKTKISAIYLKKIITAIQKGPVKRRDAPNLDPKQYKEWKNKEIRLRLGKLAYAGVELPEDAVEIGRKYIRALNRDDLTEDEYFRSGVEVGWVKPATADDLLGNPKESIVKALLKEDSWDAGHKIRNLIEKDFAEAFPVLEQMTQTRGFEGTVWSFALSTLAELPKKKDRTKAFNFITDQVAGNPSFVKEGIYGLSEWFEKVAKWAAAADERHDPYISTWRIAWLAAVNETEENVNYEQKEIVNEALNSAGGKLAEGLLNFLWELKPKRGQGLKNLKNLFNGMTKGKSMAQIHARSILASRLQALHWLDPTWTVKNLIQRMTWRRTDKAERFAVRGMWLGFLWTVRMDLPLLEKLQDRLLEALKHANEFDGHESRNLHQVFIESILVLPDAIDRDTIIRVMNDMDAQGLCDCLDLFRVRLEQAGEKAPILWRETIGPWLHRFWPRDQNKITPKTSGDFIDLAFETQEAFPEITKWLLSEKLIQPVEWPDFILRKLGRMGEYETANTDPKPYDYISLHPMESIRLISSFIGQKQIGEDLNKILEKLIKIDSSIEQMDEFIEIKTKMRRS